MRLRRKVPLKGGSLGAAIAVGALFMGCAAGSGDLSAAPPGEERRPQVEEKTLTVEGTLTDEGVECQALRSDEGDLYTLTGDLAGFGPGDRVRVVGRAVRFSFCMQGMTLAVKEMERDD